ncbi:MAG: sodium:solute symporter family protein [Candidatus Marinimicrobia bacterium]|nr:sodium:solute symporter family protein [Candidatus Neomarinimicrobiota bacterium]
MDKITFSGIDLILIFLYFSTVVFMGFRAGRKKNNDPENFLLAGRRLTVPGFVATLVVTFYGGILGIGEFSYQHGLSTWIVLGFPFYIFSALFAVLLAGKIREGESLTMPDRLYESFGKTTGIFGSLLIFLISSPAPYVLMLGVLLQLIFGWSFGLSIVMGALLSVVYIYSGGFSAVAQTDKLQFVLMYSGFVMLLFFAVSKLGGIGYISSSVPNLHLTWQGSISIEYIIVWFFIALWTLVDPSFHQRCAAAKNPSVARRGIFIAIGFWVLFDFMTISAGLYARALLPGISPVQAYPLLAEAILPPVAKGLFFIGMLSTIMSTVDSLTLISGATIGRDLIWRLRKDRADDSASNTKIGIIITLITAIVISYLIPSVIGIWYSFGSVLIPALLIPVVSTYFPRYRLLGNHTLWLMLSAFTISSVLLIIGFYNGSQLEPLYLFGVEPIFPGLAVSFMLYFIFRWMTIREQSGR